jgi:hypothetical protein
MKTNKIIPFILIIVIGLYPSFLKAQESEEKPTLSLNLKYFNNNNTTHHLQVQAKSKIDGKFQMIAQIPVQFYITNDSNKNNLLGSGVTNEKGEAVILIPSTAKVQWLKSPNQNFLVVAASTKKFDEGRTELAITKAKLKIDTADGRVINAQIIALVDTTWTPISAVDVIVGVKRHGGILNANETATYASDSLGFVMAEFQREAIPGDAKGDIVIIASVIDNDVYGNLTSEMIVPWGAKSVYTTNYNHRSLFARRGYTPIWLELLAYGIVVAVWSVIIYLLFQIMQLKKLGIE